MKKSLLAILSLSLLLGACGQRLPAKAENKPDAPGGGSEAFSIDLFKDLFGKKYEGKISVEKDGKMEDKFSVSLDLSTTPKAILKMDSTYSDMVKEIIAIEDEETTPAEAKDKEGKVVAPTEVSIAVKDVHMATFSKDAEKEGCLMVTLDVEGVAAAVKEKGGEVTAEEQEWFKKPFQVCEVAAEPAGK